MNSHIQINVVEYIASKRGRHLVVLGRIHGNEPCGTDAIERVIRELNAGKVMLTSGRLTLIPCCNPRAREENKRFSEKNLNRVFRKHAAPRSYEEYLANLLISIIGKPDLILDLHSFHVGNRKSPGFAMRADPRKSVSNIVNRLHVPFCLNGWREIQSAFGRPESFSTIDHAKELGVAAIGIECGQHESPAAKDVAYQSIREAMAELRICDFNSGRKYNAPHHLVFKHLQVYRKGGEFVREWHDFEEVEQGQPIARVPGNEIIRAPISGKITFPFPKAVVGEEWFYITQ